MEILFVLGGIFVGVVTAGYMFIQPLADRDKQIAKQKDDLSIAYKEIEQKDKTIEMFINEIERNDYGRVDIHLKHIKELAKDYQSIN